MFLGQTEDVFRCPLEVRFFIIINVVPFAFCKSIDEEGPLRLAIKEDGPLTTRPPLAWTRQALLYHATAKIGIDQAFLSPLNRFNQC